MAVTAVALEGIGREIVLVLGKAVVGLAGSHHRNAIVVCHILADGPIWSAGLDAGIQIRNWALYRSRETVHGTSLVVCTGETFLKHTVIVSHDGREFGMEIE
jgi:hypothetical protein